MSNHELRVHEENIPRLHAEEVLRDRGGSLTSDALYRVMLLAGHPQQDAALAAARRALDESRRRG